MHRTDNRTDDKNQSENCPVRLFPDPQRTVSGTPVCCPIPGRIAQMII